MRGIHAHAPDCIDARELLVTQPCAGQRPRRALYIMQLRRERTRMARGPSRRVVQLVREARRETAERLQTVVVQLGRLEKARAIEHVMHERRRELRAFVHEIAMPSTFRVRKESSISFCLR